MPLAKPAACSLDLVDLVVDERKNGPNGRFFESIRAEWRARVQAYIDACGSPGSIHQWAAIESKKTSFLTLYLSPRATSAQGTVLATLRAHGLNICPACGEAGAPNTLDHYLPKGKYPHFCVTPLNLFPMCDACQENKLEKTGTPAEPRFFIHPYFDTFIADRVVELTIEAPFDQPTFDLAPVPTLPPAQFALIASHLRELSLVERYGHFFRDQYGLLVRLVHHMRISEQDVLKNVELFKLKAGIRSKNAWEHIFYSSVLDNPALGAYLVSGTLPLFP